MKRLPMRQLLAIAALALALAGCGGGGSGTAAPTDTGTATALSVSSGTITALGDVYVNGRSYGTQQAQLVDDDTGAATSDLSTLEVGMDVDVRVTAANAGSAARAAEIHVHPLARGAVDASDTTVSTLTVMGQTVLLTAATNYSDHRACVGAGTAPCTPVGGQSGLAVTAGGVAGSYVTVHGYLYAPSTGSANIVATLVSVADAPTASTAANYKAEGVVTAVAGSTLTIGGLSVDLSAATCRAAGAARVACAGAFSAGQVVSAFGAMAPALPASTFAAGTALLRSRLPVQTAGAAVQLGGKVASVSTGASTFVLRGITVDASALSSGSLPAPGDEVRVTGVVAAGGTSVTASTVTVLHAARSATYGLEGDAGTVAAGSAANTYTVTVLGQTVSVDGTARLADRSVRGRAGSTNPFNITTFQTYLAASSSQHLVLRTQADALGKLSALSVTIVPASTTAGISGTVDAAPAPVNSGTAGTPATFAIHGVPVSADPQSFWRLHRGSTVAMTTVAAGDFVLALGSYAAGTLTVAPPAGTTLPSASQVVVDLGPSTGRDHDCF